MCILLFITSLIDTLLLLCILHVAAAHFIKLKKIKDILCDEVTRQKYNQWRSSGISISFEEWCARCAHCTVCRPTVQGGPKKRGQIIFAITLSAASQFP